MQNGFKRTNFMENIGGFAVFIVGLLIAMILLFLIRTILKIVEKSINGGGRCSKVLKTIEIKLQEQHKELYWVAILSGAIHSYFNFSITCFVSLSSTNWKDPTSIGIFVFYIIGFPLFITVFIRRN